MKWTEEKVEKLKSLATAGASNREIAQQLCIQINDVYAKRSQLGITIDKVKSANKKTAPGVTSTESGSKENNSTKSLDENTEIVKGTSFSMFFGANLIIPMAEVQHVERMKGPGGHAWAITGKTRWNYEMNEWDNPIVIPPKEIKRFIQEWCAYRSQIDEGC